MKLLKIGLALIIFGTTATAIADAPFKIGVIDINEVLQKSPQRQALATELQNEFSGRQKQLVDMSKELQKLEEKAKRDKSVLSTTQLSQLEQDIVKKRREFKTAQESFQEDAALKENQKTQKLFLEIGTIIDDIAKKEQFDLILRREAAPFYISQRVDITDQVVQQMLKTKK